VPPPLRVDDRILCVAARRPADSRWAARPCRPPWATRPPRPSERRAHRPTRGTGLRAERADCARECSPAEVISPGCDCEGAGGWRGCRRSPDRCPRPPTTDAPLPPPRPSRPRPSSSHGGWSGPWRDDQAWLHAPQPSPSLRAGDHDARARGRRRLRPTPAQAKGSARTMLPPTPPSPLHSLLLPLSSSSILRVMLQICESAWWLLLPVRSRPTGGA